IVIAPNGGRMHFELGSDYFLHHRSGAEMTWEGGEPTIGRLYSNYLIERLGKAREQAEPIADRHQAIASSMQRRLEEVVLDRLRNLQSQTGLKKLCLAGGVAFNCVVNGKILEQTGFEEVYVQSAAGDAGLAIGAATYVNHQLLGKPRDFVMEHAYWGPEFSEAEMRATLEARRDELQRQGCEVRKVEDQDELCRLTAAEIAQGKVVGWFQGRM